MGKACHDGCAATLLLRVGTVGHTVFDGDAVDDGAVGEVGQGIFTRQR